MMGYTNNNWREFTNSRIIELLGEFLQTERLRQNKTQGRIAKDAGVNRWTISQIENGEAINLNSLLQILRALNALEALVGFEIREQISPMKLAMEEHSNPKRQRARSKKAKY